MEDDIDIYGDLPELGKNESDGILSAAGQCTKEEGEQLKTQVAKLTDELEKSQKAKASLEVNLWSLLKTAKAELARKDRTISELRSKLDNFAFRRGPHARHYTQYQHSAPAEQSFQPAPAFQHVHNVVGYDFHAAQEIFPPSQSYSLCKTEEEEVDEDVRHRKEQLAKASNTVFGARLRKRLEEEEQQEKIQKSNACVEKVTESDKENDLGSHKKNDEVVDQPVVPEAIETKLLNVKTDDDQALNKRVVPPNAKCSAKRVMEEEVEERHIKRKKIEKHEDDIGIEQTPYSEFSDHNYYKSQSYNSHSKKRNKSTFEHDRFYNEHKKYRYFDEVPENYEDEDCNYEHHKRYVDKHVYSKAHSPDIQRTAHGKTNPTNRFNERLHHKEKHDYRSDSEYNHRHRNKHKEDHHATNKYDRHKPQTLHTNEYEQNNHRCKNTRSTQRENRDNFKYKDERFIGRDSRIPRKSMRKLCERYSSERKNEYAGEPIHKDVKCKRRNSMSSSRFEGQRRRGRSPIAEIVEPEFVKQENTKSPKRRSVSLENLSDEAEPCIKEEQTDCIDKSEIERDNNDTPVQEKTIDSSMMEDGELPPTPIKASPQECSKTEELIENEVKKEEPVLENVVPKEIENEDITASAATPMEEPSVILVLTAPEIVEESAHVESLEAIEEEVAKSTGEAVEVSKDDSVNKPTPKEAPVIEEPEVLTKTVTIPANDSDIIGIFGDEKDAESLTAELQQERENKERRHESPKISDEQSNIAKESHAPPLSSSVQNYNDSIEKRLEIMESSETEPNTISEFFGTFRASTEMTKEINDNKTVEKIEESGCEECPVEEEKVVSAENESNNLDQSKSSVSSTSSSSSSSTNTSSTSTSTSTSLSTSSESDDGVEKEEKNEEPVAETVAKPLETPATDIILASSPGNPELTKPEAEQSIPVAKSSSVANDLIKEPPVTEVPPITLASPAKLPRKRDGESNGPIKLNGRVVLVVRRRRPVRLSNSSTVTVVSPKSTSLSTAKSSDLIGNAADAKLRICRTPRLKNS